MAGFDQTGLEWIGLDNTSELEENASEHLRRRIEDDGAKEGSSIFAILPTW